MAVSGEGESVLPLPGSTSRTSLGGGITMTLAKSTRRLAGSGLSAQFAMLLLSLANPLNLRVPAHTAIRRDPKIQWICEAKQKHRELRGKTAAGKTSRGLGKGHRYSATKGGSRRAAWQRKNTLSLTRYRH
jgi:hypothetical protein